MATLVETAVTALAPTVETQGQRIQRELPAGEVRVLADARFMSQVLVNLLSNASKYSPEGECIRLRVAEARTMVRFEVHDRGPGIPPERQAGLFDRFYRAQPRGEQPGVGLGLAIARGIVEAHGGTIGVASEPGKGTCVWFTLPCAGGLA